MTVDEHRQVRGRVPHDGMMWHTVVSVEDGIVETGCGRTYRVSEVEISEIGERPTRLSGSQICYSCTRSSAPRPDTAETREGSA